MTSNGRDPGFYVSEFLFFTNQRGFVWMRGSMSWAQTSRWAAFFIYLSHSLATSRLKSPLQSTEELQHLLRGKTQWAVMLP